MLVVMPAKVVSIPELLGDKKRLQHQPTTGELKCAQDEADIADDVDYKAQLQALVATQNHTAAIEDLDWVAGWRISCCLPLPPAASGCEGNKKGVEASSERQVDWKQAYQP